MISQPYKFLFLCTGNSARSILGEYLLRPFQIDRRLQLFTFLPFEKLDQLKLAAATQEIGQVEK